MDNSQSSLPSNVSRSPINTATQSPQNSRGKKGKRRSVLTGGQRQSQLPYATQPLQPGHDHPLSMEDEDVPLGVSSSAGIQQQQQQQRFTLSEDTPLAFTATPLRSPGRAPVYDPSEEAPLAFSTTVQQSRFGLNDEDDAPLASAINPSFPQNTNPSAYYPPDVDDDVPLARASAAAAAPQRQPLGQNEEAVHTFPVSATHHPSYYQHHNEDVPLGLKSSTTTMRTHVGHLTHDEDAPLGSSASVAPAFHPPSHRSANTSQTGSTYTPSEPDSRSRHLSQAPIPPMPANTQSMLQQTSHNSGHHYYSTSSDIPMSNVHTRTHSSSPSTSESSGPSSRSVGSNVPFADRGFTGSQLNNNFQPSGSPITEEANLSYVSNHKSPGRVRPSGGPSRMVEGGGSGSGDGLGRQRSLIRPERSRAAVDPHSMQHRMANRPEATPVANTTRGQVTGAALGGDGNEPPSRHQPSQQRHSPIRGDDQGGKRKRKKSKKCRCPTCWVLFSYIATFYAPNPILKCFGMRTTEIRQAWREKMALVTIIILLCLAVGFLTFGFQQVVCFKTTRRIPGGDIDPSYMVLHGKMYRTDGYSHPPISGATGDSLADAPFNAGGKDISFRFQYLNSNCASVLRPKPGQGDPNGAAYAYFPCVNIDGFSTPNPSDNAARVGCHLSSNARGDISRLRLVGEIFYTWKQVASRDTNYAVYNGVVLDLNRVQWFSDSIQVPDALQQLLTEPGVRGRDITLRMSADSELKQIGRCMADTLKIGTIDTGTIGCIASDIVLYVSLVVIVGVVIIKFVLAVLFSWILSRRLGSLSKESREDRKRRLDEIEKWSNDINAQYYTPPTGTFSVPAAQRGSFIPTQSRFSTKPYDESSAPRGGAGDSDMAQPPSSGFLSVPNADRRGANGPSSVSSSNGQNTLSPPGGEKSWPRISMANVPAGMDKTIAEAAITGSPFDFPLAYAIMLVTCYSEGEHGLRTTLDSLACTNYPATHKLILVICDGVIEGAGNNRPTPDICLSMMKDSIIPHEKVEAHSYVAIADGAKRHNMARVYAGYYDYDDTRVPPEQQQLVPMVVIVKVGGPKEVGVKKAGNRGKRDSQIILMSFLQRVMFDERMTELEYEFFNAIWTVTGVPPDQFEIVLMVDADTKVYPDSLSRMAGCMMRDPTVMGLCGETKIANKTQSWVTMIQVFEYYISHHMSKAFESVFGGVTCLPGCFCMYRIKAPKGANGFYVPILANPDIVENYSENVVDTLHKKNLLLLGEDRFLTTLMLRTFPKRKMVFVPQAVCKTTVPDSFRVLLSQRRRWINSTVHNLLELVLIRDLCGTFCFSMQFVIFMELIGTVVLPAAITFTVYLIIISFFTNPVPIIPLSLLAAILGLPAILIMLTTRKLIYVMWMVIYLLSLPIWNFVLPVYAFWHFDDFTWGQTRLVQGEAKGDVHGRKEGEFDHSKITMRRWCEFERDKRRRTVAVLEHSRHSVGPTPQPRPTTNLAGIGYTAPSTTSVFGLDQLQDRNPSRVSFMPPSPNAPVIHED